VGDGLGGVPCELEMDTFPRRTTERIDDLVMSTK
jgi:hypothetical protein